MYCFYIELLNKVHFQTFRGIYLVTLSRRRIDKHLFRVERTRFDTFRSKDVAQALSSMPLFIVVVLLFG